RQDTWIARTSSPLNRHWGMVASRFRVTISGGPSPAMGAATARAVASGRRSGWRLTIAGRRWRPVNAQEFTMTSKPYPVTRTEAEWRKLLTPEQYAIMREHGTEAPGSCALNYEKRAGAFLCAGCDQPLFVAKKKFESGTGWPSFNEPEAGAVETSVDRS